MSTETARERKLITLDKYAEILGYDAATAERAADEMATWRELADLLDLQEDDENAVLIAEMAALDGYRLGKAHLHDAYIDGDLDIESIWLEDVPAWRAMRGEKS
jgi:hypothetical protein